MDEHKIIPYIEPIFRFCYKRLISRYDAEDLASEIICHVLEGMNKYQSTEEQYETVFRYPHTLSSEYRNIFVDYYIGELSIRSLAKRYSLPETTIKWRLNVGRQKIRDRIGENKMDKVYRAILENYAVAEIIKTYHNDAKECNFRYYPIPVRSL